MELESGWKRDLVAFLTPETRRDIALAYDLGFIPPTEKAKATYEVYVKARLAKLSKQDRATVLENFKYNVSREPTPIELELGTSVGAFHRDPETMQSQGIETIRWLESTATVSKLPRTSSGITPFTEMFVVSSREFVMRKKHFNFQRNYGLDFPFPIPKFPPVNTFRAVSICGIPKPPRLRARLRGVPVRGNDGS